MVGEGGVNVAGVKLDSPTVALADQGKEWKEEHWSDLDSSHAAGVVMDSHPTDSEMTKLEILSAG